MADKLPVTTIDEYIQAFPAATRAMLEQVRQAIRTAAPEATETISYGIPTFDLQGKHLVFFAGWKRHIAVYPLPAGDEAFQRKIASYRRVKSTIRLPLDQPLPSDLVAELVAFLQREKPAANDAGGPSTLGQ